MGIGGGIGIGTNVGARVGGGIGIGTNVGAREGISIIARLRATIRGMIFLEKFTVSFLLDKFYNKSFISIHYLPRCQSPECTQSCDKQGMICYDVSNKESSPLGHQYFCRQNVPQNQMKCNRAHWIDSDGTIQHTHEKCQASCRRPEITGATCNTCINTHWGFPNCKGIMILNSPY